MEFLCPNFNGCSVDFYITATLSTVSVKKLKKTGTSYRTRFPIDTYQRIWFSFILELSVSFFKVVQDANIWVSCLNFHGYHTWQRFHLLRNTRWRKTNTELINYSLLTQWFIACNSIALKRVEGKIFLLKERFSKRLIKKTIPTHKTLFCCHLHLCKESAAHRQKKLSSARDDSCCTDIFGLRFFLKSPAI